MALATGKGEECTINTYGGKKVGRTGVLGKGVKTPEEWRCAMSACLGLHGERC
jgi:hypothetical protein